MHGRLKVRTTAEQQAAKAKERAVKVEKLNKAKQFIFSTMSSIDSASSTTRQQLYRVTADVLSHIPEFHTVWNVRKRLLLRTKAEIFEKAPSASTSETEQPSQCDDVSADAACNTTSENLPTKEDCVNDAALWNELATVLSNELNFIVECIRQQPKAYPIWYHRIWLYSRFLSSEESQKLAERVRTFLEEDLRLTEMLLAQDERNFHCWEFRSFLRLQLDRPAKQELAFLHERIANNFSNYSAWHRRCELLFDGSEDESFATFLTVFNDEFELLENAFYTDPADQSSWCYYRWLLGKALQHTMPSTVLRCAYFRELADCKELVLVLSEPLSLTELTLSLATAERRNARSLDSVQWRSARPSSEIVSSVWLASVDATCKLTDFFLNAQGNVALFRHADDIQLHSEANSEWLALRSALERHAQSFSELAQLETDGTDTSAQRNCLLTRTVLLEQLEAVSQADFIRDNYAQLARLDAVRQRVYESLRARFDVRLRVATMPLLDSRTLDLSALCLSSLPDCRSFAFVSSLNLSGNQLAGPFDSRTLGVLRALVRLDLSDNRIAKLTGLDALLSLRYLNLAGNLLENAAQFAPLASLSLEELDITRNVFAQRFSQLSEDDLERAPLRSIATVRYN